MNPTMNQEIGYDFFSTPGEHTFRGIRYPGAFQEQDLNRALSFPFSDDDIIIDTYPKSGTTWLQEIVYLIVTRDFNVQTTLNDRIPFLEFRIPGETKSNVDKLLERSPTRIIKTHLPYRLLKDNLKRRQTKVIVGIRNVKDMLVSYYHFYRINRGQGPFTGTWDQFFELFRHDKLTFGNWFDHVLGWWNQRHSPNVHFVMFEDLKQNLMEEVRKLAHFLGHQLTDTEVTHIFTATSFSAMKINPLVNKSECKDFQGSENMFFRKGSVGDWKSYFTPEQNAYVDDLLKEKLHGSGLNFVFEIGPM